MPTPPEMLVALQGNEDPDAMVLLQLAEEGADLRKPHEPEFAFELNDRANAEAIAKELCELDYDVQLYEPDEENPEFQVVATRVMVLELHVLSRLSLEFEALAEKHAASYDGWGAEIVE